MSPTDHLAFCWARQTYGPIVENRRYQALRFFEEAVELAQAMGLNYDDLNKVTKDVINRRPGIIFEEVGDVQLSLSILSAREGISSAKCFENCIERISRLDPEKTRAKDRDKIGRGLI